MDHTDPQQFRVAFRQVVVDQLLKPSDFGNCQDDLDSILLSLNHMATQKTDKRCTESASEVNVVYRVDVSLSPPCVPQVNVISYMSGYLLRRYPGDICASCAANYVLPCQPGGVEYEFLQQKAHCAEGTLIYGTPFFVKFVSNLESTFMSVFEFV